MNLKKIPYVNLSAQWESEKHELLPIIEKVMASGSFILGEMVESFEAKVAKYCKVDYCVALNSGTDALMCGLMGLGVKPGDEVITPPNSFIASTAAIIHIGAVPVFVDVQEDQLIDVKKIEKAITHKTKAIMPVHLTGKMADMVEIKKISKKYSIPIIEDAAQSIGSSLNGEASGSMGQVGCFSTHPLKNLNACGDGGFLISNDQELVSRIKSFRNHGFIDRNVVQRFGLVSRMDEVQAAILNFRIKKLNEVIRSRRRNAQLYRETINTNYLVLPKELKGQFDSYHTFVIQCENRESLIKVLNENNIQTAIHYPCPIHLQPAASGLGYNKGDFPMVEAQSNRILTLPIHQYLEVEEIKRIGAIINKFYGNKTHV